MRSGPRALGYLSTVAEAAGAGAGGGVGEVGEGEQGSVEERRLLALLLSVEADANRTDSGTDNGTDNVPVASATTGTGTGPSAAVPSGWFF